MRTTKYKAWDRHNKVWVGPYTLKQLAGDDQFNYDTETKPICSKFDDFDWVEWTGLLDKNGKEIYEGDLCKQIGGLFQVVWWKAGFSLEPVKDKTGFGYAHHFKLGNETMKKTEVIGNVWENPELLK